MVAFLWIPRRLVQPQQWLCGGGMWVYGAIIWVCEGMHPCVLMWKPEQDIWCLSPLLSALLPWESVCYWTWNFSAQLAHSEILGSTYVYPHNAGVAGTQVLPGYLHGDLNSGLHTDDTKSLTEPSLLPLVNLLWWQWFLSLAMFFCVDFCGNFFFHCLLDNLQGLLYFLYTKSYLRCILQFTVKLFWSF